MSTTILLRLARQLCFRGDRGYKSYVRVALENAAACTNKTGKGLTFLGIEGAISKSDAMSLPNQLFVRLVHSRHGGAGPSYSIIANGSHRS